MAFIVLYTAGTLGDHLPHIALAAALQARGHRMLLVINRAMLPWAKKFNLPAVALTDVDRGATEAQQNAWAWDHWNHPDPRHPPSGRSAEGESLLHQARDIAVSCRGADLLLATGIRPQGLLAQRATGIPWLTLSMNPFTFSPPASGYERERDLATSLEYYRLFREAAAPIFRRLVIPRPLPEWSLSWQYSSRVVLASSVHFSRPDTDQLQPRHSLDLTGFWFYEDPDWALWRPDPELEAFCARRPIVLAFSSQPLADPRAALALHVEAAALLGLPLLVQRGWAGFSEESLPAGADRDAVLFRDFLPHDWVFARAACAIQHGGIGTMARALRQGCPILVEPYGNDQFYNARRVHELGVGAAVNPFEVPAGGLASVLADRVLIPEARRRAERLGVKLAAERGVELACDLVEAFLAEADRDELQPRWRVPSLFERTGPAASGIRAEHGTPLRPATPGSIPRVIHHFRVEAAKPGGPEDCERSWREHHPDWEHLVWGEAEARELIQREHAWFLPVFDAYTQPIQRREAVRCFLLHHHGGVCVDPSLECLRPVGPLLAGCSLALGLEPEMHHVRDMARRPDLRYLVGTSFLASVPSHPFWEHVARALVRCRGEVDLAETAGPIPLTRACDTWQERELITLLPAELVAPIDADESWGGLTTEVRRQLATQAFAVNHWQGGWWRDDPLAPKEFAAVTTFDRGHDCGTVTLAPAALLERQRAAGRQPLVSCLMVTRDRPGLARRAVGCFLRQDYPARELVIVDDGDDRSFKTWIRGLGEPRIRHLRLPDKRLCLGDLRNFAVQAAAGELVAQWDDDDLFHPQRLALQVAALAERGADATLLERQILWWPRGRRLGVSSRRVWEGSLLARASVLTPYPALRRGEDTPVISRLLESRRVVLLDAPWLYVYCCHGRNSFDAAHWERFWQVATVRCRAERYDDDATALIARFGVEPDDQEPASNSSSGPSWPKSE